MTTSQGRRGFNRSTCLITPLLCLIAVFSFLVAGSRPASAAEGSSPAYIRIIHAAPDIGIADVFFDGQRLLSSFQYATITGYTPLPAGTHEVQIALIGKGINASVISQKLQIQPGMSYTVAALGKVSSGFSIKVFQDNNYVSGSNADLRFYHLSPDAGTAQVENSSQSPIVQNLNYEDASNYIPVQTGNQTYNVTVSKNKTIPFSINVKPWTINSVFTVGDLSNTKPLQVVTAQVQGLPGMPNTGSDPRPLAHSSAPATPDFPFFPWLAGFIGTTALLASIVLRRYQKKFEKHLQGQQVAHK
jgi:hypothetical protein